MPWFVVRKTDGNLRQYKILLIENNCILGQNNRYLYKCPVCVFERQGYMLVIWFQPHCEIYNSNSSASITWSSIITDIVLPYISKRWESTSEAMNVDRCVTNVLLLFVNAAIKKTYSWKGFARDGDKKNVSQFLFIDLTDTGCIGIHSTNEVSLNQRYC